MYCNAKKAVWFTSPLGIHVPPNVEFNNWFVQWLSLGDISVHQLFCVTLWKLWQSRNNCVFNCTKFDPAEVAYSAVLFVEEFNRANDMHAVPKVAAATSVKWQTPPIGFLKLNVDPGCFPNDKTGWGMVVRDHTGSALFASTK
jgi:hypothetical protein